MFYVCFCFCKEVAPASASQSCSSQGRRGIRNLPIRLIYVGLDKNLTRALPEQTEFWADNCQYWILWRGSLFLPGMLSEHWQCPWRFVRATCEIWWSASDSKRTFSGEHDLAAFGLGKYLEEKLSSFLWLYGGIVAAGEFYVSFWSLRAVVHPGCLCFALSFSLAVETLGLTWDQLAQF